MFWFQFWFCSLSHAHTSHLCIQLYYMLCPLHSAFSCLWLPGGLITSSTPMLFILWQRTTGQKLIITIDGSKVSATTSYIVISRRFFCFVKATISLPVILFFVSLRWCLCQSVDVDVPYFIEQPFWPFCNCIRLFRPQAIVLFIHLLPFISPSYHEESR